MDELQLANSDALDEAIAQVAREEFNRLSANLSPRAIAQHIERALRELQKFGRGNEPDFEDEWVALFYVLWYHPKHTNLVYRMTDSRLAMLQKTRAELPNGLRLHIADFGCGSLAMQFGTMFSIADALARGQRVSSVRIEGFDASGTMLRLGEWIWSRLARIVNHKSDVPALDYLRTACGIMESINGCVAPKVRLEPRDERWLSAIHTVYEQNIPDVEKHLNRLADQMKPNAGFLTTFVYKEDLIYQASPFEKKSYDQYEPPLPTGLLGHLEHVSKIRHRILNFVDDNGGLQHENVDDDFITRFLRGDVDWKPNRPVHLIYTKR